MAVQMHVSHSSIMRGVGVIAGVTYDCANSSLSTSAQRVVQGLQCLPGNVDYAQDSIARTDAPWAFRVPSTTPLRIFRGERCGCFPDTTTARYGEEP